MFRPCLLVALLAGVLNAAIIPDSGSGEPEPTLSSSFTPQEACEKRLTESTQYGFFEHFTDCSKFLQCNRVNGQLLAAVEQSCGAGTFWRQEWFTCVADSKHCKTDLCLTDSVDHIGYHKATSCKEYYQCDNGVSKLRCCPSGTTWDQTTLQCVPSAVCTESCSLAVAQPDSSTHPTPLADECYNAASQSFYKVASADNTVYKKISLDRTQEETQKCPAEMPTFSVLACGCVGNVQTIAGDKCNLFEYTTMFGSNAAWVKNVGDAALVNGAVCLSGSGHLEIPYYNTMDWNQKLSVAFDFKADAADSTGMLLTNGDGSNVAPSIEVRYDMGYVITRLLVHGETKKCSVSKKVLDTVTNFHRVVVTYGGTYLWMSVDKQIVHMECKGDIEQTPYPMVIGKGFKGCLDDVKICRDLPKATLGK